MATANIKPPQDLTGNTDVDIEAIHSYLGYMREQLNYHLNNIDEDNLLISVESEE